MDKSRLEVVIKDIKYLKFTPVKKLALKHYDIIPETRKFFGMFVDREELRDGWSVNGYPTYCEYYERMTDWWSIAKIESNNYFQIGKYSEDKPWYARAEVLIQKSSDHHVSYFKTNEDAEIYLEEIKEMCGENFKVIIDE